MGVLFVAGCAYEWDSLRPRGGDSGMMEVDVPAPDTGNDAGQPNSDTGNDAGVDVPRDTGNDTGNDTGVDAGFDTGVDVPRDTGNDTGNDVGFDTGPRDTGNDVGFDVGFDTGPRDTGNDVGFDVGFDIGFDLGPPDTGNDVGFDLGPPDTGPPDTGPSCSGPMCACAPGVPNGWCRVGETCTAGTCVSRPLAGALIITEVMNDIEGTSISEPEGEWIEVYNPASHPVDIRGIRVRDAATVAMAFSGTDPLLVPAQGYAVLARTANLGISGGPRLALAVYDTVALNNSGNETVTIETSTGTLIDTLVYGSGWPNTSGRSKSLRPGILDATMNDTVSNWCAAGMLYAPLNYGSPGAANTCQ